PVCFQGERNPGYWLSRNEWWRPKGARDPMAAVAEVVRWANEAFPDAFEGHGDPLPGRPALQHRFAGLLMLADWIGSHPAWFPVRPDDLGQRLAHNRWAVPQVMRALGLDVAPLRPVLHQVPPG